MNRKQVIKTATLSFLILSLIIPMVAIGSAQACWWRRSLRANLGLDLSNARPVVEGEPGYDPDLEEQTAMMTWTGSISGDINGYMRFYLTNYIVEGENGEWGHFYEVWQIFDEEGGTLLMEGYDEGYTHQPTGYYAMVGRVTETGPGYSRWHGHVVFMHGRITPPPAEWGTNPDLPVAPGYFRVF